jgi:hypothetical protein
MPTADGAEFRQDDIDVARKGGSPLAQIAKDFGLSVTEALDRHRRTEGIRARPGNGGIGLRCGS